MKLKFLNLFVCLMAAFAIISCGGDDPDTIPGDDLAAAFEVSSTNGLTVSFQNNSVDATAYQWDFGDNNSSTDKDPTHTYTSDGTYTVTLTALNGSDSKTATQSVTVANPYRTSGYVLGSVVSSSGGATYYAGYFADLPSGNIDMTQKQASQRLLYKANHKGFLYGRPTNGDPGLDKFAVDATTDEIVLIDQIPLLDSPGDVAIIDDETGLISYFGSQTIDIFNPQTMQLRGTVSMAGAKGFPAENDANGYNSLTYNSRTGKIYATAYTNNSETGQFYDATDVWVEVIDATSLSREKTITHPNATYALFRGNINTVIDEAGNTYLLTQGSYGLDGQFGAAASAGSRPQIIKINTNSEFDTDYAYNPINSLVVNTVSLEDNFFQLFTSMVYAGNNKVYGIGTTQSDIPEIVMLLQELAAGTITSEGYNQLVNLVLYDESMSIIEVDLNAKSASIVSGAPKTAGFAYPFMYNYNGTVYSQMTSNGGAFNGFYSVNPTNNAVEEVFNITAGGLAFHFIDLSAGF